MNDGLKELQKISFLGISICPATVSELTDVVGRAVEQRNKVVVANHNLHSLYLVHRLPELRKFFKLANFTHIDGMAIVLLGRLYGHRISREKRVTYVDWTVPLMDRALESQWRIFYLGAKPGVAARGASYLRNRFPGLRIRSTNGYLRDDDLTGENESILEAINLYQPHLLMVGMGMPRQELWIQKYFDRLQTNVILPVGATIDYIAGTVPTPPRWLGKLCLEWLFRLACEPRRLWRRYLCEPLLVLAMMFKYRFFQDSHLEGMESTTGESN